MWVANLREAGDTNIEAGVTFKNAFKTRFHRNASIVESMNLGETLFPGKIDKNETRLCAC